MINTVTSIFTTNDKIVDKVKSGQKEVVECLPTLWHFRVLHTKTATFFFFLTRENPMFESHFSTDLLCDLEQVTFPVNNLICKMK